MTLPGATRPQDRLEVLTERRNLKMARSAHAYVRGSTVKFYEWLDQNNASLPDGPPVWICGDCHIGNLGPLADANGAVDIQIRDLDQTVIGNPAHDLVRLGLSLASAARGSDLPGVTTAHMIEQLIAGYEHALAGGFDDEAWGHERRPKVVRKVLKQAMARRWRHLAEERLENVKPDIPLGKRFWALTAEERKALTQLFQGDDIRDLISVLQDRKGRGDIEVVDAAYWMKGCSSLGRLRYAVLLQVSDPGLKDKRLCLIDVKEGLKAAAPRAANAAMPRDNAQRVVEGARALSPNLGNRMAAGRFLGKAVVLRELMPQDLKIEIDQLTQKEAISVAWYLAGIVGKAHGRQMDAETRKRWTAELARRRPSGLDAPSWLWTSVVELMGAHEEAYLDHCMRYAVKAARAA